jgi:hypothetical protein
MMGRKIWDGLCQAGIRFMEPAASLPDLPMPTACPWAGYARRYRILGPECPRSPRLEDGGFAACQARR